MQNNMHAIADCHFSLIGAARYLGRSPRWLQYQLDGLNPPPGYKIGRAWLFRKSELDRWLEQFRAGADLDKLVNETLAELGVGK